MRSARRTDRPARSDGRPGAAGARASHRRGRLNEDGARSALPGRQARGTCQQPRQIHFHPIFDAYRNAGPTDGRPFRGPSSQPAPRRRPAPNSLSLLQVPGPNQPKVVSAEGTVPFLGEAYDYHRVSLPRGLPMRPDEHVDRMRAALCVSVRVCVCVCVWGGHPVSEPPALPTRRFPYACCRQPPGGYGSLLVASRRRTVRNQRCVYSV